MSLKPTDPPNPLFGVSYQKDKGSSDSRNERYLEDTDMVSVILDIKEKIKKINAEEQQKMPTIKFIPMEDIVFLGENLESKDKDIKAKPTNNDVFQYNILLRRQQQLTQRKLHIVSPLALEGRARQLLGANSEERMVDENLQEMLARSQAERYYKISESDNLLSDLNLESFQKPWGKLEANLKINRLMKYAEKLQTEYILEEASFKRLRIILIDAVNKRKITRKNDVQYNEELGQIMDIRGLIYDKETKSFSYESDLKKLVTLNRPTGTKTIQGEALGDKDANLKEVSIKANSQECGTPQVEQITSLSKEQIELLSKKKKILITIKPKINPI